MKLILATKSHAYLGALIFILLISIPSTVHAWGFWAHQRLNRMAIFTLPPNMLGLYKDHIEYLTEHAVDPDKRRYAVEGEAENHYIDIDHYGENPFEVVPRRWDEAVAKFTEDTLCAYGISPYNLVWQMARLTTAFKNGKLEQILKLSADIGHYVGDAHVPLHTTENYNGQLTGQKGIHGFWESRLPELFGEQYNFLVGRAYYIEELEDEIWTTIQESHYAVDSVLSFERILNDSFPADKKYGFENRNNLVVRAYSRPYAEAYHTMLGGMVERRMRASVKRIGAFWYTAWKNAGSPNLNKLRGQKIKGKGLRFKRRLRIVDREAN
ncbi:MAG: zinc dependent phospholipase C family protein [Bacteroidota bacterium]